MELYAAGFNAWRQLEFEDAVQPERPPNEPTDVDAFQIALKAPYIGQPYASLSYTLG